MAFTPEERQQANDIHNAHRRQVDAIRNDGSLSAEGRRGQLARNYLHHQGQLDQLYTSADAREQRDVADARRRAFGLPAGADGATVLAHRDARERVANASPGEAARLLEDALNSGDRTMQTAVGQRAFDQAGPADVGGHWGTVLERFAGSSPARQRAVGDLADQRVRSEPAAALHDRLLRHISKPSEISAGDVHQIAAQAGQG